MSSASALVVFTLDEQQYALRLPVVERVIPAVAITPLPHAPDTVLGVINVRGRILPVLDIRKRSGLPAHDIRLSDQFIVAHTARRPVALVVDSVSAVLTPAPHSVTAAGQILPGTAYVAGVVKLGDGMIVIHDLDQFLSLDEEETLDRALSRHP